MREELLQRIPDRPEWVETRSALLEGGAVFGTAGGAAVLTPERDALYVIGKPGRSVIAEAVRSCAPGAEILAQEADQEHVAQLIGTAGEPAVIHAPGLGGLRIDPHLLDLPVEVLGHEDGPRLANLPPSLRAELTAALDWTEIAACLWDGELASFCYPGSWTETWWDVSLDTLEHYRRRGCSAAAFWAMAESMRRRGKLPAWGALESNEASWRLARKLGFEPVGRVFVWSL